MSPELKFVSDFALFARVVESGNITQCAANLGYERTTVSRRISSLESQLGVRLLDRTTQSVSVTKAGRRCYEQCAIILRAAQDAQIAASNFGVSSAVMPLVVGASASVIEAYLSPALDEVRLRHPAVEIELRLVDAWTDEIIETLDIGLALGPVRLKGVWTTKVGRVRQVLCASPPYVAAHGEPTDIEDLEAHPCIVDEITGRGPMLSLSLGGQHFRTRINVRHAVTGPLEARQAVIAGLGVACLPLFMCEQLLLAGQLLELLPGYEPPSRDLLLLSPKGALQRRHPTALRLSLESALTGLTNQTSPSNGARHEIAGA
jgi:DNA-binding transcriptional LysR family regulator